MAAAVQADQAADDVASDLILDSSWGLHVAQSCMRSAAAMPSMTSRNASQAAGRSAAEVICKKKSQKATLLLEQQQQQQQQQLARDDAAASAYLQTVDCSFCQVLWRWRVRETRQSVALHRRSSREQLLGCRRKICLHGSAQLYDVH
jgi:hypothetical protein